MEYDGVPMLELEWTRCRSATAHRMACHLDNIRLEMKAMFESATMHQVIIPRHQSYILVIPRIWVLFVILSLTLLVDAGLTCQLCIRNRYELQCHSNVVVQMIMATSTEDIVRMLNPSQQRVPEPPPVAGVGYTAAGFSRCELMKEALKPHCKPLETGAGPEEIAAVAGEANASAPEAEADESPEEPAQKRARTAPDDRQAPSPAASAALENGPPGLDLRRSSGDGPTVSTSAACAPESKLHFPAGAENDTRLQHNGTKSQVPKDDMLNPLCEAGGLVSKAQAEEARLRDEIAAPRSSTDTPAPSNLGALMSRSGSEPAPASASPNTGGATSVATQPQQQRENGGANQAEQAVPQGKSAPPGITPITAPPGITAPPAIPVDRMRGSGPAADAEGVASSRACCSHAVDSSGGRACPANTEACRDSRDQSGATDRDPDAVVRLRGSGDDVMGAASETSDEFMDAAEPSDADVENQPAASGEPPQGMNEGEREPGDLLATSAANNTDLVESALGALGAIGWGSPGLNRPLRVTNARLQSAVGACVQATSKKVVKKPKAAQPTGKVQAAGVATALTQVGDLEEQASEVALNFMASVERGHKVYGVHAPGVLKPASEVLACSSGQPGCSGENAELRIEEMEDEVQRAGQPTSSNPEGPSYVRYECETHIGSCTWQYLCS